jgi:hypothetical protein
MPVLQRNRIFHIYAPRLPAGTSHLVRISIISILENIIDAHTPVSIIVIIRLPHVSEGVYSHFIIIPEVMSQYFKIATIHITAKDHSLAVWFSFCLYTDPFRVCNHFPVLVEDAIARVSKIEI